MNRFNSYSQYSNGRNNAKYHKNKKKKHFQNHHHSPQNAPVTVHLPKYANSESHIINDYWHIYAHDKRDTDFTNDSYEKCFTIETLEDFWLFFNNVNDFTRHQFYIMRKNIQPRYEVPENINGGTLSYLILQTVDVKPTLIQIVLRMICEKIVTNKRYYDEITGIYLNPKQDGANLKIWFKDFKWLQNNISSLRVTDIKTLKSQRLSKHNNINNQS